MDSFTLAGFVAGEGCFCITKKLPPFADGSARLRFRFQVKVASRDRAILETLQRFLGFGSISDQAASRAGWQPTSCLSIGSLRAHHAATIPFAEEYLLPCAKRRQFEGWRDAMAAYELAHPTRWGKGASTCTSPDADSPSAGAACAGRTTTVPRATETARFLGGFTAAEGCFTRTADPGHFSFAVGLGAADGASCELLVEFLGVGTVHRRNRRQPHYDDEVIFQVRKLADLVHVVVPFMDAHLPASSKRGQYEAWRADLLDYWVRAARRRRSCSVEGCDRPRRAHGLCRRHLYQERSV